MRIAYIQNARIPTEKAHGYQLMKTCEALVEAGAQVQLFVAERRNTIEDGAFEYYAMPKAFDLFRLPVVDAMDVLKPLNALAYAWERASFIRSVKRSRLALLASDIWYTRDPLVAQALVEMTNARPVFVELHDADPCLDEIIGRVTGWVVISEGLKKLLTEKGVPSDRITVAHDGFDPSAFEALPSKAIAREKLGLKPDEFLLLYSGHLYPWKGMDSLAPSFKDIPEGVRLLIVGGYPEDIERIKTAAGESPRVSFMGQKPREEVSAWLAAADAALLPTSAKFEIGKSYTSPLKLFEYLAAGLPVLTSDVPSSREILDESVASFFKADNGEDFLKKLDELRGRSWSAETSKEKVKPYSWKERGRHIGEFVVASIAKQSHPMGLLRHSVPRNDAGILIVTQAVDEQDTNLAFFLHWIAELATHVPVVHVAAWSVGTHRLPANVHVYQMPKGRWKRIFALMRLSISIRKDVEAVFVHMLAPVAAVLGWYWRVLALRVVLWYTHGSVPRSLRVANLWVDAICTATDESLRLKTIKKIVTGHGIETGRFRPGSEPRLPELITVGRISARKRLESLLDLVEAIRRVHPSLPFRLRIIGEAYLDLDKAYADGLSISIQARGLQDVISLDGAKLGDELLTAYQRAAVFVTASETGSLDKAVLEALSCGTPVLASSPVFAGFKGVHIAERGWDEEAVAFVASRLARPMTDESAREDVGAKASLKALISRLVSILLD
ncbi:glycosyltransferase family 4 protein [Patescibacteria group bacterium]|jgi:glycosyltransferase involved in cell wall biosynthesis|nr:glycosyltransferase family 4 protein [Patescibacteria group bacterium]